nr:hypothetical protein CFP56_55584 [Quercus suber]
MGKIKGIKVGKSGVSFTHLLFDDDSLFFFQNEKDSILHFKNTIQWYCSISSQSINFNKLEPFCSPNISQTDQESLAISLQVNLIQYPNKYLVAYKNKKSKKSGAAFEALNIDGVNIFSSGNNFGRKQQYLALQDAMSEAVFKAKELGFNRILILSTSMKLDKLCNHYRKPDWLEKTLYTDLQ